MTGRMIRVMVVWLGAYMVSGCASLSIAEQDELSSAVRRAIERRHGATFEATMVGCFDTGFPPQETIEITVTRKESELPPTIETIDDLLAVNRRDMAGMLLTVVRDVQIPPAFKYVIIRSRWPSRTITYGSGAPFSIDHTTDIGSASLPLKYVRGQDLTRWSEQDILPVFTVYDDDDVRKMSISRP